MKSPWILFQGFLALRVNTLKLHVGLPSLPLSPFVPSEKTIAPASVRDVDLNGVHTRDCVHVLCSSERPWAGGGHSARPYLAFSLFTSGKWSLTYHIKDLWIYIGEKSLH
jgi:hypothetical protein